jgi:thiopurine S-methyltransferase
MNPDFWHERWQNRQIGFHRDEVHPYLTRFWPTLGIAPGSRVFVPLCGKSNDLLWLRAQGYEVVGAEVSPIAVREFFEENHLTPSISTVDSFQLYECDGIRLYCGDFFALTASHVAGVSAVYDRAALVALPPEMRGHYARHLLQLLASGVKTLLVAFEYPQHEMPGPPFNVDAEEIAALFGAQCDIRLLLEADILAQEPRFRDKGVTRLKEAVYVLRVQDRLLG